MSRGRKERTPAQLAVLAQAREKAKIVIAERAKLNALAKKDEAPRLGVVDYDNDERTNTNKYFPPFHKLLQVVARLHYENEIPKIALKSP